MGDEPYFIDSLTGLLAGSILTEAERAFGQVVVYGKESEAGAVINLCRQMPMMGAYQVVIVREAQQLRGLEKLSLYTQAPAATTILVLCHKEKNMDKRWQLYKHIEAKGIVFESVRPRDYELPAWISEYARSKGFTLDAKAAADADRPPRCGHREDDQRTGQAAHLPATGYQDRHRRADRRRTSGSARISTISSSQNPCPKRTWPRRCRSPDHFARNPKDNPLLLTLSALFTHFQRIFIVNYQRWLSRRKGTPMPSEMELARMLKLPNAFFLKEYTQAASAYPNNKVFMILGLLREYDLKSKGMNTGQADDGELLKELLLKILIL